MKRQILCMRPWCRLNLLCRVRHASSEVTFLCTRPTDCVGTFRIVRWKESRPAAIFHLRHILACQSRQRQSLSPSLRAQSGFRLWLVRRIPRGSHFLAGRDQCWRFEASGHLCSKSMWVRGEVDGMGDGQREKRSGSNGRRWRLYD